jgi:hypothetical protein
MFVRMVSIRLVAHPAQCPDAQILALTITILLQHKMTARAPITEIDYPHFTLKRVDQLRIKATINFVIRLFIL